MIPKARPLEEYLPADLQVKATMHFTPPSLARHVAKILAPSDGMNVLDVGAGAGMFCIAAAQVARWAHFVGVEWRPRLVEIATRIAGQLRVPNVEFVQADALALDWSAYDAFYFYNPFAEHVMGSPFVIDRSVPLEPTRYDHYVDGVYERLATLRARTRVVTYHGFGGDMPRGYALESMESYGTDRIELWIKR